jgi:hypothetical protein
VKIIVICIFYKWDYEWFGLDSACT